MATRPVHVVTGFLGSGKTTLLSRALRDPAFADTAVVINELGEVGLDHLLVDRGSEDDVVLLDSGCLCCALGNSLQETLESLHYRRERAELPPFARVVVETTGVADPGPIAATLALDSAIVRHYHLGSIVTVVDALHGIGQIERFDEARRQVAMADRLVVSKAELSEAARLVALDAALATLNPHAPRMINASDLAVDSIFVDRLQEAGWRDPIASAAGDPMHEHHDHAEGEPHTHLEAARITTTTIRLDAPLDWLRYADWVGWTQRTFGERLLRMKGAVRMEDGSINALHAVMHLFSAPVAMQSLPETIGNGVIVLITQDATPAQLAESRRRIAGASLVGSTNR